jgi:hypothetical protein
MGALNDLGIYILFVNRMQALPGSLREDLTKRTHSWLIQLLTELQALTINRLGPT